MIRVSDLVKYYGARRAISEINFNIKKGEVVGFLGPNGAGKTTTMRILAGYIPPTSGKVEIGGFDILEHSIEARHLIGYLPETVPLYPDMTVSEYLHFMGGLHSVKNLESRVGETLALVHLEDRAKGYISNLSKGMRQRVGLAQALIHRPEVLILDEPTIGLDPAQIKEVRDLIREIGKEHTVLLSTHILSEAQQICNRVLIINDGQIIAEDTPERLQARLSGAQRVRLRVLAEASGVLTAITPIHGVSNAILSDDGAVEFEMQPGEDVRPQVARTVIERGYDLLEFQPVSLSLEDIFLQLTQEQPISSVEVINNSPEHEVER